MKGFSYTPILIGLAVIVVAFVAYSLITSSFFPPGLSDLQKVGYLLDQKGDLNEFYYQDNLSINIESSAGNSNAQGSIEFFKKNENYRLKLKLPGSFALGIDLLDFYYLNGNSTACYSMSGKTVCSPSKQQSVVNSLFPKNDSTTYTNYFGNLNSSIFGLPNPENSNRPLTDYISIHYVGTETNFGRSCRKFVAAFTPLFFSDYNLTSDNAFNINFCIDDHLGFLHDAFVQGDPGFLFSSLLGSSSSDAYSNLTMIVKLTGFRTTVSDADLTLPQASS
ncbi:Uncharacterised protein [uncultured archaeon]|nr:Uncharacterised protein [uncultured archaeon]